MICINENCYHKRTRRGSIGRDKNSWSIQLCPCCLRELINMGSITWKNEISKNGCKQYLGKPEPEPRIKAFRNIQDNIKLKTRKKLLKYTKVNSDKSKVDRSIIF